MLYYNSGQSKRFTINMMRRLQVDFDNLTTFNYYPLSMAKPVGFDPIFDVAADNGTIDSGANTWSIDWTVSDRDLTESKNDVLSTLAGYRYSKEQSSISYLGNVITVSRDTLSLLHIAHSQVTIDPAASIDFKTQDGWVNYSAALMEDLVKAVADHIQIHFTAEKNVAMLIDATTTVTELRAINIITEFDNRV